jgi:hypothetical protein
LHGDYAQKGEQAFVNEQEFIFFANLWARASKVDDSMSVAGFRLA